MNPHTPLPLVNRDATLNGVSLSGGCRSNPTGGGHGASHRTRRRRWRGSTARDRTRFSATPRDKQSHIAARGVQDTTAVLEDQSRASRRADTLQPKDTMSSTTFARGCGQWGAHGILGLLVESAGLGVLDERLGVEVSRLLAVEDGAHLRGTGDLFVSRQNMQSSLVSHLFSRPLTDKSPPSCTSSPPHNPPRARRAPCQRRRARGPYEGVEGTRGCPIRMHPPPPSPLLLLGQASSATESCPPGWAGDRDIQREGPREAGSQPERALLTLITPSAALKLKFGQRPSPSACALAASSGNCPAPPR